MRTEAAGVLRGKGDKAGLGGGPQETDGCAVYTDPDTAVTLGVDDTLAGGEVLPGFAVPVADIFGYLD